MINAIDECISRGADPTMIRVVCAITCPVALGKLGDKYPGLRIYAAMIDEELNEKVVRAQRRSAFLNAYTYIIF